MNHYFQQEPLPIGGFTPDADFPLIYAEKGIMSLKLSSKRKDTVQSHKYGAIIGFTGGERENMVPDHAKALVLPPNSMTAFELETLISLEAKQENLFYQIQLLQTSYGEALEIKISGVSAHGSLPHLGSNAVVLLAKLLHSTGLFDEQWISFVANADTEGRFLGIHCTDAITGNLTCNLGIIESDHLSIDVILNVRYPVDQTAESLVAIAGEIAALNGFVITSMDDLKPLYVPKESVVVRTLASVYEEETNEQAQLLTIGGGTYARAIPNAVAFGPLFPMQEELAHQKDEYFAVHDLVRVTAIYAKAIWELSNADWSS